MVCNRRWSRRKCRLRFSRSSNNLPNHPCPASTCCSFLTLRIGWQAICPPSTNISQDCNLKGKQTQIISVIQQDGHVEISDNVQSAMADLFVNCVQAAA